MSSEEAKENYIRVVNEQSFVVSKPGTFEERHEIAKEMLNRELDLEEYGESFKNGRGKV